MYRTDEDDVNVINVGSGVFQNVSRLLSSSDIDADSKTPGSLKGGILFNLLFPNKAVFNLNGFS